jgi:phospholipase/carboxylesterase
MSSRRATLLTLLALLALASAACNAKGTGGGSPSSRSLPAARSGDAQKAPADAHFKAPSADGWGLAGSLRYLERTVGGGEPTQALPLVIMIHGMGDAPRFDWFRGADAIKTPMRVVMPRAPLPYYDGFSWFPYSVEVQDMARLATGIAEAADALARAIEILRTHRPSLGRAIVTGFSQGGMLSYALALRHPELVEFSHPISGLLPEQLWPASKPAGTRFPRIAAMHGVRDGLVPIDPARRLCAHLSKLGYDVSLREFAGVRHEVTDGMEAYTVELLEEAARAVSAR